MKKIYMAFGILLAGFAVEARADVCYDVSESTASQAAAIIKTQKVIYDYCSICQTAKPHAIKVKTVESTNSVMVNGKPLDLAHTYYKENNKYINLGIKTGCIHDGQYNISAELNDLPEIHRTEADNQKIAKSQAQKIYDKCFTESAEKLSSSVTSDMVEGSIEVNDCLNAAINQEIKNGFDKEQQAKMEQAVKQLRQSTRDFYVGVYAENKYCIGHCGTITNIIPYADENKILSELLERLLYLNIAQNGY